MTVVIKAQAGLDAPRFKARIGIQTEEMGSTLVDREMRQLAQRIQDLEQRIAVQSKAIVNHSRELSEASDKAAAEGYARGFAEAVQNDEKRINILRTTAMSALRDWEEHLARTESLAVLVAKASLDKMFGETGSRSEAVLLIIRRHIDQLRQSSIVSLRVSAADFPGETETQALVRDTGLNDVDLLVDPGLPAGSCIASLGLGEIDLGQDTQWASLREALDVWVDEEASVAR